MHFSQLRSIAQSRLKTIDRLWIFSGCGQQRAQVALHFGQVWVDFQRLAVTFNGFVRLT